MKCHMLGGDVVLRVQWSGVVHVFGNDVVSHVPPYSDGEAGPSGLRRWFGWGTSYFDGTVSSCTGRRRLVISICLFTVHICYPWLSCGSIAKPCGVMVCVTSGFDSIDSIVSTTVSGWCCVLVQQYSDIHGVKWR